LARCLVTGAAGFIGSHLCEGLLDSGNTVLGVDAFTPNYSRAIKENNLTDLLRSPEFSFHETDLRDGDLVSLLRDVDVVFHLAALPGLLDWDAFGEYVACNILGTQRLLEAARENNTQHFIHGSTSSVYGRMATGDEETPLQPCSPYGITKQCAEELCKTYALRFGLPITIFRFFSVYGPRQRPDMAYNIFTRALFNDEPIVVFGDGSQSRSNTFVADIVQGIVLAFEKRDCSIGETFNIGGGEVISVIDALRVLEEITGRTAQISYAPARPGDQKHTAANTEKARRVLGYAPTTSVKSGLQAQVEWQKKQT